MFLRKKRSEQKSSGQSGQSLPSTQPFAPQGPLDILDISVPDFLRRLGGCWHIFENVPLPLSATLGRRDVQTLPFVGVQIIDDSPRPMLHAVTIAATSEEVRMAIGTLKAAYDYIDRCWLLAFDPAFVPSKLIPGWIGLCLPDTGVIRLTRRPAATLAGAAGDMSLLLWSLTTQQMQPVKEHRPLQAAQVDGRRSRCTTGSMRLRIDTQPSTAPTVVSATPVTKKTVSAQPPTKSTPKLSEQQLAAVAKLHAWFRKWRPDQERRWFYISGLAGTGKSTLIKPALEKIGLRMDETAFCAFTGKAAHVMKKKGLNSATTIHSLLYKAVEVEDKDADGHPIIKIRFERLSSDSLDNIKLIVCDEVSMVGEELGLDLLALRKPILVLGDPGQLPPVKGTGFFTSGKPDVHLTEVHRQALGNPILAAAMAVRENPRANLRQFEDGTGRFRVVRSGDVIEDIAALRAADQIICGFHATRIRTNNTFLQGRPVLARGDKILVMHNNPSKGVYNGSLATLVSIDAGELGDVTKRLVSASLQLDDGGVIDVDL